jgi:hypothetical protein
MERSQEGPANVDGVYSDQPSVVTFVEVKRQIDQRVWDRLMISMLNSHHLRFSSL